MIRKLITITLAGIFILISLTGCLPGQQSAGKAAVIIVEPVEAAQFQVGDLVKVLSLLSSEAGIAKVDLIVNGNSVRSDVLNPQMKNGNMLQSWIPAAAGVYTLQVRTTTAGGQTQVSTPVGVNVIDRLPTSPTVEPATITPSPTPFDTLTPTETSTPIITMSETIVSVPMNIVPSVTSIDDTSCRTGPSSVYPVIGILGSGEDAVIIGSNHDQTWWFVQQTNGVDCWVWDGVVTVNGTTGGVSIAPIPPTPDPTPAVVDITAPIPVSPSGSLTCRSTVNLKWNIVITYAGVDYYEWKVRGPNGIKTGRTSENQTEFMVGCGKMKYSWSVRAVDALGNVGPYSQELGFVIK